jgi:tyrosyl-tRNA synthetase
LNILVVLVAFLSALDKILPRTYRGRIEFMLYTPPVAPADARADAVTQAKYLLEDGFLEIPADDLAKKIGKKGSLRVKFGVDPTAPAVTWGWSVPLRRLRRFQELGHTAILVIGDYTAQVGDPSGKSRTRTRLSSAEVEGHVRACMGALLGILSPDHLEVRRNSEWLGSMGMSDVLQLASQATVAQLLERTDFSKRFAASAPISLIEFIYPLLQGHDSVAVEADVELGGVDQQFNFVLARSLQQRAGQDMQTCICAPLLVGTDGTRKMSQSYGNYINVADTAEEIFGKVMSIPDEAMPQYIQLALDLSPKQKAMLGAELSGVGLKRELGKQMVAMFHGMNAALGAEEGFNERFVRRQVPADIPTAEVSRRYLPQILLDFGWARSLSDARRLVRGRGVRVDGEIVSDENLQLEPGVYVLQVGKRRFTRVTVV